MNIIERYLSYFRESLKEGWQGIFGSFIGYSILGTVIFFVLLPFAFGVSYLVSGLVSPEVGLEVLKGYFVYYIPVYFLLIILINGFLYQRVFTEDSLGEISPEEVNNILMNGTEDEKIRTLRLLPKSSLSKVFIRETLRKTAKSSENFKIREVALASLGNFLERNPVEAKKPEGTLTVQIEAIARKKGLEPLIVYQRIVTIENLGNKSIKAQVGTAGQETDLVDFPLFRPQTFRFSIEENVDSPLAASITQTQEGAILHLTNTSKFPINNVVITLDSGQIFMDEEPIGSSLKINEIQPNSALNFNCRGFEDNSTFLINYSATRPASPEIALFRRGDTSLVTISVEEIKRTLTDKKIKIILEIQNSMPFDIILESLELDYISDLTPDGQLMKLDKADLQKMIGEIKLLSSDKVQVSKEANFPIDEQPTFRCYVNYSIPFSAQEKIRVEWTLPMLAK